MEKFFKMLSDRNRLRCLMLLIEYQRLCVCELSYALQLSQPSVSRHLSILKSNNLIRSERYKQWIFYFIRPGLNVDKKIILQQTYQAVYSLSLYVSDRNRLKEMEDRPKLCSFV